VEAVGEGAGEVPVVAHGGEVGHVLGEGDRGKRPALLDDGMGELHRHVRRIAGRAAVAHGVKDAARAEALRHRADAALEKIGVIFEKREGGPRALLGLAQDGLLHGVALVRTSRWRPYWK